jgi:peptidoglycan/xylan/chitin deacetylase (PgdA/CDA1 family)
MRLRGQGIPKQAFRWARRKLWPSPLIVGYHRIAGVDWNPQHLCVRPERFAEHLEVLERSARATTIKGVTRSIREGRSLERAFIITFDDGYADTLEDALPTLERYGVPASVFVPTGMIAKSFWWCEVEHWIKSAESLPEKISIEAGEHAFRWQKMSDDRKFRQVLLKQLGDFFRALPSSLHDTVLSEVRKVLGSTADESGIRAMTAGQIEELSKSELIEIGSHLVTHTPMDRLAIDEQRRELYESGKVLEEITGCVVDSFAYPNSVVSDAAPSLARELGYRTGVAGHADTVRPGCDPFVLPRVWPGDWDGDRFGRWLRWWL